MLARLPHRSFTSVVARQSTPTVKSDPTSQAQVSAATASNAIPSADRIPFIVSTTESISGFRVKTTLGLVAGSTVRTRNVVNDVFSTMKSMIGGELEMYTQLLVDSREEAMQRMKENAVRIGANGIIATRVATSNISQNASEVVAYGTAVVLESVPQPREK